MKNSKVLVIGVIALREAKFWSEVIQKINLPKENIFFISFCSISTKYLEAIGKKVFCIYKSEYNHKNEIYSERKYNDPIFLHESLTFLESKKTIFKKYQLFTNKFGCFLKVILNKSDVDPESVIVIQELGAFAPVIALYDVSLALNLKHYFLEPSVLTGHTFALRNTLDFYPILSPQLSKLAPNLNDFCKKISVTTQIASKDIENVKSLSFYSVFSLWKRFFRKLLIKFSPNEKTYYDKLLVFIYQRLQRYISDFLLKLVLPKYRQESLGNLPFAYYPLHSDIDFALTIRNAAFLNQFNNLKKLLKSNNVVIKQHPARSYTFKVREIVYMVIQNLFSSKKLYLANNKINSLKLSSKANFTYFISSKAGIFAMLCNFKTYSPVEIPFENYSIENLYGDIVKKSFPFDLYNFSKENLNNTIDFLTYLIEDI